MLAALLLFAIIWLTENVQTGLLAAAMVLGLSACGKGGNKYFPYWFINSGKMQGFS